MPAGLSYQRGTSLASILDLMTSLYSIQTINVNTTLSGLNNFIKCSGNTTITLPDATAYSGFITIFKTDSAATTITVNTQASQTINGHASVTFTPQYYVFQVFSDGVNWLCTINGQQLA